MRITIEYNTYLTDDVNTPVETLALVARHLQFFMQGNEATFESGLNIPMPDRYAFVTVKPKAGNK